MAAKDHNLLVRLTASERARIETAAKAAGVPGVSTHARNVILAALDGGEVAELRHEVELLRKELARLHRDLGNSVIRLLQHAGTVTKDDAAQWAKTRLSVPPREKAAGQAGDE